MSDSKRKPSGDSSHMRKTSELPERAGLAARRLCRFNAVINALFQDENFITLLRAESMPSMPSSLFSASKGRD
jgi:hypothetical protein